MCVCVCVCVKETKKTKNPAESELPITRSSGVGGAADWMSQRSVGGFGHPVVRWEGFMSVCVCVCVCVCQRGLFVVFPGRLTVLLLL